LQGVKFFRSFFRGSPFQFGISSQGAETGTWSVNQDPVESFTKGFTQVCCCVRPLCIYNRKSLTCCGFP
jgi:hypothetical protein